MGTMLRALVSRNARCLGYRNCCRRTLLTEAFIRGPSEPPLLEQTVGQHFASVASHYGDRDAVISRHQNLRLTYEALDRDSNALAGGLENIGVGKGDRVAVSLGNGVEFATVTYALFKLGAILVPLNPAFTTAQVASAINHLTASHLIISTETNLSRKEPRSNVPLLMQMIKNLQGSKLESEDVPSLKQVVIVDNSAGRVDVSKFRAPIPYQQVLEDGGPGRPISGRNLSPDEVVNIQFTSGTTSMPKAACLTHRSILNNGNSIGDRMLLTPEDVICCPPPLYHCFGCILGYMASATHGSCIVFPTEAFDPLASLRAVQEYGCTALYGVPTMFIAELELLASGAVPNTGLDRLRTGIAAGTSIPAELMRKLHKTLNLTELTICYGMTETSPVSAMTTTDDPIEKRVNTVGRLLPHVVAKVVHPENPTKIMSVGERGELAVSGYLVMKEYWGDRNKTHEVMIADKDGVVFMHTGDEAMIDEDGYVKITGRLKDIIIRGGENIHPLDVENALLSHEAVSDASAVAVPDERYGEVVGVFIIKHPNATITAEEARSWVRDRINSQHVPKYVFWVDNYPKTPSGKIQKFLLREQALELLRDGKGD